MKELFVAITILSLSSCGVDPQKADRILKSQGMTEIRIDGFAYYGCAENDDFGSFFSAKDTHGQPVSGVICGGWLKGYTVRFD